jgi:colanic acid biosynthesis glycosyl transferase WcaI
VQTRTGVSVLADPACGAGIAHAALAAGGGSIDPARGLAVGPQAGRRSAAPGTLKIALLSAFYAPELTGIGPYSAELAEALAAKGHTVRVVAAFPFYPEWRPRVPPWTLLYRTEQRAGASVTRCRVYVPRNPGPLRRLAHELSWTLAAGALVPKLAVWADVWLIVTPAFGSALLGAILARRLNARVHLHVQDVVPDVALESGQLGPGTGLRMARRLARWTYRSFESVSALSESMTARPRRYTGKAGASELIAPNWVRRASALGGRLPEPLRRRSYALYAGSFGRKQDLALLTEAAGLLRARRGPRIAVLGDGPGRDVLERAGDAVVWLGLVDEETYRTVLEHALAGIVALAPGVGDSVVPSKLAAYLGAGRPVVAAVDGESEVARVVDRARCGVRIPPGRADLLADSLCLLCENQEMWQAFASSGRSYAKAHWEKEMIVGRIEAALLAVRAR